MKKVLQIALAGNPNSGKTTVFNLLTGMNQKVANFPGVTVDKKTGRGFIKEESTGINHEIEFIDLPGTYSLYPKTPDEKIPFQVLCDPRDEAHPDLVIIVADASNLKRSLFLCSQIVDLRIPSILALNMMDLVKSRGIHIDINLLQQKLGIPVVPMSALSKSGVDQLKQSILRTKEPSYSDFINIHDYSPCVLAGIKEMVKVKSNYAAFQIANNMEYIGGLQIDDSKKSRIHDLIREFEFDAVTLQTKETLERYQVINDIIKSCVSHTAPSSRSAFSKKLDEFLTHKIFGFVFFIFILFLIFQAIFSWSSFPMDWIESSFSYLSNSISTSMPDGILRDLLINGILAGLSGVIIFVPQIASLFFFIAILEDSGYMARVSFLMDRLLRPFGLNGKSVIPLASGVACAIPAIMSTRTISNRKERLLTIFVTPLMSCSARIPVYTLLISLVIPSRFVFGVLNMQALVLMALYLLGFLAAIFSALLLKSFFKSNEKSYFIMEMPLYRMPRWNNIGLTIIEKVKIFVYDAGKVIVAISIILWFLSSFGPSTINDSSINSGKKELVKRSEKLENSYAGIIGKSMEPIIQPLGFDWKIGIALITSFAAREVFVGTMSTIYSIGNDGESNVSIRERMETEINPKTGEKLYSPATGISLMIFYAFALQCMSTIAVSYRETKNIKFVVSQLIYLSGLAYLFSFIVYQVIS